MNGRRSDKPHGYWTHKPGMRVTVKHCHYSYRLPDEIPEGATVTIVSFDTGYYVVEYQGKQHTIAINCVVEPYVPPGESRYPNS
jgi:hypothetical protein